MDVTGTVPSASQPATTLFEEGLSATTGARCDDDREPGPGRLNALIFKVREGGEARRDTEGTILATVRVDR